MPPQLRQMLAAPAYALQEIRLAVVSTVPKGVVHIEAETEVELRPEYEEPREDRRADVTYDDVGGMAETIDQLREMVELRSEEHTSELQSLMRTSNAVFSLKK